LLLAATAGAQTYSADTLAVRQILNANGWTSVGVSQVSSGSSRITELDLSKRPAGSDGPITTMPAALGNLTGLTSLNLSNNEFSSLPTEIGNLTALTTLRVSNIGLTSLPASIGNLVNLTDLHIENNNLTSLPATIGNLSALRRFYAFFNNLTSLPDEICNLSYIHVFQFSYNQLSSLPDSIGKVGRLWPTVPGNADIYPRPQYYFDHNQLTSVPVSLGNRSGSAEFYELKLNHNKLTSIPASIITSGLRLLDIQHNRITSLPDVFTNGFGQFNAYNNLLTTLPPSMGNCHFNSLFLNDNLITSLPDEFSNISVGAYMYGWIRLQNNLLTSLPDNIGNITVLGDNLILDLSNNQLTSLPASIGNLTSISELYLSDNQLTLLPDEICKISELSWFKVENNQLTDLPDCITLMSLNASISSFNYNRLCNLSSAKQAWLDGLNTRLHADWDDTQIGCGTVGNRDKGPAIAQVQFSLSRNVPNPFNASTQISFTLPEAGKARLEIFTAAGALVQELTNRTMAAGAHTVQWDTREQSAGIYFYKLTAGRFTAMKKCILIK
jgi:Leucine-rich repeat (LRR) protein